MTIDITPIVNVFGDLLLFLIGVDLTWCGYWYMKTLKTKRLPRLLGYLTLKLFERANRIKKPADQSASRMYSSMFSMEAAGKYLFVGGIALIATSLLQLATQLFLLAHNL